MSLCMVPRERMNFLQSSFGFWLQVNNGDCLVVPKGCSWHMDRKHREITVPQNCPHGSAWGAWPCVGRGLEALQGSWNPADVALQGIG